MRKWLPAILIGSSFAVSAALLGKLPPAVGFPTEALLPPGFGDAPDTAPRIVAAFGLPLLALVVWGLLFEAPVRVLGRFGARLFRTTEPVRYEVFAPSYRLIVAWVVCFILSLHVAVLGAALGWPINAGLAVGATLGVGLILVGNVFPRLRPNPIAGIRTARTMADPIAWARVHRAFGALWVGAGVITLVVAVLAPRYALAAFLASLILSGIGGIFITRSLTAAIAMLVVFAGSA